MCDEALETMRPGARVIVDEFRVAMEALGAKPRWCLASPPGISMWTGDRPCVACEHKAAREAGRPIGHMDDDTDRIDRTHLSGEHAISGGLSDEFREAWGYR